MTRTGFVPALTQKETEPTVYLNPLSIERAALKTGQLARLVAPESRAEIVARVKEDDGVGLHSVYLSMHWAGEFGAGSGVNHVTESVVDPFSGQPAFKSSFVEVEPFAIGSYFVAIGENADKLGDIADFSSMQITEGEGQSRNLWRCASKSVLSKQTWTQATDAALNGKLLVMDTEHGWVTLSCANDAALTVKSFVQVEDKALTLM
ncbi:assimilatory nitrate reductase large subunit [Vibrio variabilis]|uniref:Assimilatory nitrate reductase large subunit n=1 Tax=Vibrio variabilis TaxID=990271 RepID=A0ABQ0JAU1_9VIBR|nr:assimilatory nitrate reductase large subunit [Vibrio variabilis]